MEQIATLIMTGVLGALVGIGLFGVGAMYGQERREKQAIRLGYATRIIKKNGSTKFQWKPNTN